MKNKIRKKEMRENYDYFTKSCNKAPFLGVIMFI
ncbi:Uncharacterised protein [uncultured archaeon]|nr:Uncharacterised protein [uncultured archaeon]